MSIKFRTIVDWVDDYMDLEDSTPVEEDVERNLKIHKIDAIVKVVNMHGENGWPTVKVIADYKNMNKFLRWYHDDTNIDWCWDDGFVEMVKYK